MTIDERWISEFIERVRKAVRPEKIILFGSRAHDEHVTWSDYDIAVVSDAFDRMHPAERIYRMLALWEGARPVEVVCFTPGEFERNSVLLQEIKKGKILYSL